jgi:CBS domain-containing protein
MTTPRSEPLVSQLMTQDVAFVRPETRLVDAARLMRELHVSGLPVVGPDERVIGVVSEWDLVRSVDGATGVSNPRGLLDLLLDSAPERGQSLYEICRHRLENGYVRDLMTSPAITVTPTTTAAEAARFLANESVRRLPVVGDDGKLVGILTHLDLIRREMPIENRRRRGALHPRPRTVRAPRGDPYADV